MTDDNMVFSIMSVAIQLYWIRENYRIKKMSSIRQFIAKKNKEFEAHMKDHEDVFNDHLKSIVKGKKFAVANQESVRLAAKKLPREWQGLSMNTCLQMLFDNYKSAGYKADVCLHSNINPFLYSDLF